MISDNESTQSSDAGRKTGGEAYLNDHRLQGGLPLKEGQEEEDDVACELQPPVAIPRRVSVSERPRRQTAIDEDAYMNKIDMNRMKILSNDGGFRKRHDSTRSIDSSIKRRGSRSSIDSDPDSHASRSSQETEEDVCFPMLREHVRIKGIDFDEIEEFIKDELQEQTYINKTSDKKLLKKNLTNTSIKTSATSIKYTPKYLLSKLTTSKTNDIKPAVYDEKFSNDSDNTSTSDQVKFGQTRIQLDDDFGVRQLPDRFSFFNSENEETIHSPDIPGLVLPGQSVQELFTNGDGTWWLDCSCPTDSEMKMLAKAFGIHPLTAEDIRMQETREKVELFRNYYFVCFHTFEQDNESEDYLEPINVYIVVFGDGVLSFHFSPINHPANVRRRVRQLRDYVDVSADWLCYALIDDITDGFAPVITGIEYEADMIEDSVFVARETDFAMMLKKIGQARRKVMTLMRLLSGKADVIKMFAKRCQDEASIHSQAHVPNYLTPGHVATPQPFVPMTGIVSPQPAPALHPNSASSISGITSPPTPINPPPNINYLQFQRVQQPRADIALYLGDIQDHVVTMFQNLLAYEKIFSRSHGNYMAQLQVESFNSNNKLTQMFSKVTLLGTILIPLNVITGLFGMNVHVPGEGGDTLSWFFGIIGCMVVIVTTFLYLAHLWLNSVNEPEAASAPSSKSIKSFKLRAKDAAKSVISFPNKYD